METDWKNAREMQHRRGLGGTRPIEESYFSRTSNIYLLQKEGMKLSISKFWVYEYNDFEIGKKEIVRNKVLNQLPNLARTDLGRLSARTKNIGRGYAKHFLL